MPDLEEEKQQIKSSKVFTDIDSSGRSNNNTQLALGASDAGGPRQAFDSENGSTKSSGSDHEVSKRKLSPLHYGTGWEASLMGFTIVAGGQLYGWNAGQSYLFSDLIISSMYPPVNHISLIVPFSCIYLSLSGFSAGFGSYFIAQVMVGFAYVILLCCLGENTAALAFPGGSYGLARVCLGFYAGYVVACFEMMEYIFMSSAAVFYVGQMAVSCANLDPSYAPVFWLLFYGFGIATTCSSLKVMWYTSTLLCIVILSLVLIYCIGSAKYTNLAMNGPYWNNTATYVPVMGNNNLTYSLDYTTTTVVTQANGVNVTMAMGTPLPPSNLWNSSYWFVGGMSGWMSTLAVCTWGYAGIECLVLMTDMMKEPKKNIPIGCAGGITLLFATNIATTIICAAMPPGLFTTAGNPTYMSMVYQLIFPRLSDAGAWLLILPGQIGMGWGFFAPVGKLLQALGQSNLLPRFLCLNGAESHRTGVVVGCAMGLVLCIIGYFNASFGAALQNIAIASGCIQYFANLYAYILLKTTFKQVERDFKSPFGIPGAVLCMCIFMLVLISTLFFQSDGHLGTGEYTTLIVMCALVVFLALWYYTFVTGAQRFSPSEQKTVFRLHVYQFNMKKNKTKESEIGIFQNCAPIMAMYALYATLWNKFDKTTKRISKNIDEKFDANYALVWQYFTDWFNRSTDDGNKAVKEGLSMKSEFSSVGRKSLAESNQVFIAPPPAVTTTVP